MVLADRQLTEFSATLVGVQTLYSDATGAQTIQIMSGGYADEITESYDNLVPVGSVRIAGADAAVLTGSLLTDRVRLVFWKMSGLAAPCDNHVIIATNVPEEVFNSVVGSIAVNA
ncbi:MAG: hypothetical protein ABI074_17095 [Nakamurella sp.]